MKGKAPVHPPQNQKTALWWITRLSLAASLCSAIYLAIASGLNGPLAGCGGASDCREILQSPWAYAFGVPVSVLASLVYASMLLGTSLIPSAPPQRKLLLWNGLTIGSFVILISAAWFIVLQSAVLRRFCPLCTFTHICGSIAALTILTALRPSARQPQTAPPKAQPVFGLIGSVAVAMGLVGILVAQQRLFPQATHKVVALETSVEPASSDSQQRILKLPNYGMELNLKDVPLHGSTDARLVVVNLFDYTCYACRLLHAQLREAQPSFTNQLAVVSLPVALDKNCNPLMKEFYPAHSNSCQTARIGLAVWRAAPNKFQQFDDWMLITPTSRTLEETRQKATELVGEQALAKAMSDEWVEAQFTRNLSLFASNCVRSGSLSLPQLLVGTNLTVGAFKDTNTLFKLIEDGLALTKIPEH